MLSSDHTLQIYNSPRVVEQYVKASGLQPCETYAFDTFIQKDATILDIGVGGGRTTPYLAAKASYYLGVDYADSMVEACQKRFPDLEFRREDATNLASMQNATFDVVVFSFNGIDSIPTDEGRRKCLAEAFRVLKPGGKFIFSSHNAKVLAVWPILEGVGVLKKIWRVLRSFAKTSQLASRQLRAKAFYAGTGYILDPVDGGLHTFTSTPSTMEPEVRSAGFKIIEVVDFLHPKKLPSIFVPWYCYILLKP
jgi:SAM-dependent methyltransferase